MKQLICPLLSTTDKKFICSSSCAFYMEDLRVCSIKDIANSLGNINVILDSNRKTIEDD